jgi:endonuclease/exonuclease/phosphatase family metal-dependent hydrolase
VHASIPQLIVWALLASSVLAYGTAIAHAGEADPGVIEVMSANLRWRVDPEPNSWELRRERVAKLFGRELPDVVGLQEARRRYVDDLLERLPGYAAYAPGTDSKNTILFRVDRIALDRETSDAENARVDAPEQSWGEGSIRLPVCARLVLKAANRGFYLYNNHFDHRSLPSRTWSASVLIDRVRARRIDDPVVLTGDFNARPGEVTMAFLRGEAALDRDNVSLSNPVAFLDTFAFLHPAKNAAGTYHGFRGVALGRRIDYIFAGPGFGVLTARILHDSSRAGHLSDHYPVAATLWLPQE